MQQKFMGQLKNGNIEEKKNQHFVNITNECMAHEHGLALTTTTIKTNFNRRKRVSNGGEGNRKKTRL